MASHADQNEPPPDSGMTEVIHSDGGQHPLSPGMKLKGRYLIERELGRGGIGVVYLARDERLHSMPVVIKFLLEASGQNAWLATKFLQEAEALTRINHPGVVKVIDRDSTEDGRPFFVMEFVSGRTLRSVMRSEGMDLAHAARILRQIGQALNAAHLQGVVHRDLKPENILLQTLSVGEEQVKVIDFGIAKVSDSQSGAATEVAVIAGSLQYIAPEQMNSQPVSAATDLFSLGIVAYEMVTGRRPFETDAAGYLATLQQVAKLQQNEEIIRPCEIRPSFPEAAQALILGALSFEPQKRPQDARIFGDELAKALSGEVSISPAISPSSSALPEQTEVLSGTSKPGVIAHTAPRSDEAKPLARSGIFRGLIAFALVTIILVGAAIFWIFRSQMAVLTGQGAQPEAPAANVPTERTLTYSVTVQKDPQRYPRSKPFQLPGEVIFSPGDRIHLDIASPQSGYLYIINEGPPDSTGVSSYNALFPTALGASGSAEIGAGQSVRIPEQGDGFVFDSQEGTEKLWLIFAENPVSELEAIKRWVNPQDRGQIKDQSQANALRQLLSRHTGTNVKIEKDEQSRKTILRAQSPLLIRMLKLEHH